MLFVSFLGINWSVGSFILFLVSSCVFWVFSDLVGVYFIR